jgi:hypothetical protein
MLHPTPRIIRRLSSLLSLALPLAAAACGDVPTGGARDPHGAAAAQAPPPPFPTREELGRIAAVPVPAHLFDDTGKDVPTWDLGSQLPDAVDDATHEDATPWGQLFGEAVAGRSVAATLAMHCVAQETAAFVLDNQGLPAVPLQRFIAARCGLPNGRVSLGAITVKADDRIPDAQIFAHAQADVKKSLVSMLPPGGGDAGIAYARKNGRVAVVMTATPRMVRMERTPLVPGGDGTVFLRGELLQPATSVRGVINRGRFGFARCTVDRAVALPRFSLACPTSREDEVAWLEVAAFPPGHIMGVDVVQMLVWPAGNPGKTYARLAHAAAPDAPPPAGDAVKALVQELNRVRKEAGLRALVLAEKETQSVAQLAPYYFAGLSEGGRHDVADVVALGLRAGWEVDGTVREGNLVSNTVTGGADLGDVLREALARPFGRETLLDPAAERVAVGSVADPKDKALGAVFATYQLFDGYRHDQDAAVVVGRLDALRAARGMPGAKPLPEGLAAATRAAAAVQAGTRTTGQALDAMLEEASRAVGGGVSGAVVETSSLDDMKFPPSMLAHPDLHVVVAVSHYRPAGHAWGRFVVFVLAAGAGTQNVASRGAPSGG